MKKIGMIILISVLLLSACGKEKEEVTYGNDIVQPRDTTMNVKENNDTNTQEGKSKKEPIIEAAKEYMNIYYIDLNMENICLTEADVENVDAEGIIELLSYYEVIPEEIKVNSFEQKEENGNNILYIDLNDIFQEYLEENSVLAEKLIIGCIANTFIDYYDADGVYLTVDGNTLKTTSKTYDSYIAKIDVK